MSGGLSVGTREDGRVLEITLDRAERGNALSATLFRELTTVIERAEKDASICALLIRSSRETFCMGGDISNDLGGRDPRYSAALHDFTERWLSRSIPALALVEGGAQAFGCALAISSDLVFTTEKAWFALPELMHGLVPVYALAVLNASGHTATGARMMWQGRRFSAREISGLEGNVLLYDSTQEAVEGVTETLERWMGGGNMDSLRRARRYINRPKEVSNQQYLLDAREALRDALADADEDPKKAQSYLDTEGSA